MSLSPGSLLEAFRPRYIVHLVLLPAIAGLLLSAAVPPSANSALAIVCLIPLLWKAGQLSYRANALRGVVFTFAFYFFGVSWILDIDGFEVWHMFSIATFLSIGYAVFMIGIRAFASHSAIVQASLSGMLWITLEYLRNHAGFLALPWTGLGQAAVGTPSLLQLAALTGEYGLSFVFVFSNSMLAAAIEPPKRHYRPYYRVRYVAIGAGVPILFAIAGLVRLQVYDSEESMNVLAVHSDRPASVVESYTNGQAFSDLKELTTISREGQAYDLVVWPEGTFKVINAYPFIYGSIHGLSREIDSAIAFGISSGSKYMRKDKPRAAASMINEFALIDWRTENIQTFSKKVLVPFGEYIPLDETIPWPSWLIPDMAQFRVDGKSSIPKTRLDVSLVPVICWENLFADAIRARTVQGPAIGLNISDLSVFRSERAVRQHNAATVMRAVENGIPFIAATNTGPSLLVAPTGQILAQSSYGRQGYVSGVLPIPAHRTPYWRFGDLLVITAALMLALWPLWGSRFHRDDQIA